MPRFVLLYHECSPGYVRASHWDFMLEHGDVLRTWAVPRLPKSWRAAWERTAEIAADCPAIADDDSVSAEQLGDHQLAYLENEGPLSGNRGVVRRIDAGEYEAEVAQGGDVVITLQGDLIHCGATLRIKKPPCWSLSTS